MSVNPPSDAPRRTGRAPAFVNGAVAATLLAVIAVLGVSANQSSPPEVAAFTPQLQSTVRHNTTGLSGAALGGVPANGVAPTATPAPTPTPPGGAQPSPPPNGSPAIRPCYGNPPRQTPDPQSPPCVPYYPPTADNGGATSMGVSRDTIYVAWPDMANDSMCNGGFYAVDRQPDVSNLVQYFNDHFELYNRKVVLKPFCVNQAAFNVSSAQAMQTDANKVYQQLNPGVGIFASLEYAPVNGASLYYYNQLANDGIVSVNSDWEARDDTANHGPFEWETQPGQEGQDLQLGNLVCNQLRGKPEKYLSLIHV